MTIVLPSGRLGGGGGWGGRRVRERARGEEKEYMKREKKICRESAKVTVAVS